LNYNDFGKVVSGVVTELVIDSESNSITQSGSNYCDPTAYFYYGVCGSAVISSTTNKTSSL